MKRFSIIACIPAFNEEVRIASVLVRAKKYVTKIIVCDDGSTDLTGEIAKAMGAIVVSHNINEGKGIALNSAFMKAYELKPDVVVMFDADGQHDPNDIPKLIKPIIEKKADVVIGSRYLNKRRIETPFYRRIGLNFINILSQKTGNADVHDTQSGFRAFSYEAFEQVLKAKSRGYGIESEQLSLIFKKNLITLEVPIDIKYRNLGVTSKKNPTFHGFEVIDTIITLVIQERPLLYLAIPGAMMTFVGLLVGLYSLWYFNNTRYFSVPMVLITVFFVFLGMFLLISAMLFHTINRFKPET